MGEWKRVKLGEIADLCLGKMLDAKKNKGELRSYLNNVAVRWGGFDLSDLPEMRFEESEFERYSTRRNDIIACEGGEPGRCAIWESEEPIFLQKALHRIRVHDGSDPRFVYYQFCHLVKSGATQHLETGSTIRHLPGQAIREVELQLPDLPTQRRIAAVLGALDDKIEVNRKICENLEAQAQALFKAWFVDFEPFGGKRPEEWKLGKLGDVGEIVGGATPSKANSEYYTDDGIAWITPKDISLQGTKFIAKGEIDITEKGFKSASVKLMSRGSVLFSSRAPIGYVAIARNDICTNQGFKSVVPKDGIGTCFVYEFLKLNKQLIEDRASGSTFKEISTAGMRDIPVMIPDIESLKRFETSAWSLFLMQENKESESRALAAMRDALLPKLMSGELAVEKVEVK